MQALAIHRLEAPPDPHIAGVLLDPQDGTPHRLYLPADTTITDNLRHAAETLAASCTWFPSPDGQTRLCILWAAEQAIRMAS